MKVMVDLVDRHGCFISMEDGFLRQDFHQSLFKGLQRLVQFLAGALQSGLTDRITEHFLAHLTDPLAGSLLAIIEVGEQSAEILPILERSFDVVREGSCARPVAAGALFYFSSMFGAFQFQRRQIEDLAALKINGGLTGEIFAALTLQQGMNLCVLGIVAELQSAARVAGLAAWFAARLFAQALGLRLFWPVGGRRTRAVAAVLSSVFRFTVSWVELILITEEV